MMKRQPEQERDLQPQRQLDTKELERIIRPEINLEKVSIWRPESARDLPLEKKTFSRDFALPDGLKVKGTLTISPTVEGDFTTKHQRIYYAIIKLWEDKGRSIGHVPFSKRGIARILGKSYSNHIDAAIKEALLLFRITPFILEYEYKDQSTGEDIKIHDKVFNILSDLKIIEKKKDGHITHEAGYFRFSDFVLKNLYANNSKPLFFDVAISFQSEIAQILYTHLDLMLYAKPRYERRSTKLFEDLRIKGKAYKNAADRKRTLERALTELRGARITSGIIKTAQVERTEDKTDWKLVCTRGRAIKATEIPAPPAAPAAPEPDKGAEDAQSLVRYFHQVFFGASEKVFLEGRALDQARTLIAQHGYERAKAIIDYARRDAKETAFKIRTFGGVMQYQTPALNQYDRWQAEKRANGKIQSEREAERRLEMAELNYFDLFADAYFEFFFAAVEELKTNQADEWARFEDETKAERKKVFRFCEDVTSNSWRQVFAGYVRRYFDETHPLHVPDFWQWDKTKNPEGFDPLTNEGMLRLGVE